MVCKTRRWKDKLAQRKLDQQQILLERIRDREHAEVYTQMLVACESDIAKLGDKINRFGKEREAIGKNRAERQFQNAPRHL